MAGQFSRSALFAAAAAVAVASPAGAEERRQEISIPAQPLGAALRSASRQSGSEIVFADELVARKRAPRVAGSYTAEEAVRALLDGSGLTFEVRGGAIIIVGRSVSPDAIAGRPTENEVIIVTGTRIRGARSPSPLIRLTSEDMRVAGQANLEDVIRSIPQNFGGGQNPGVGVGVPERNGSNIGSGSAINLRGLGQDATLTLLNGHRLAYNSAFQGVDISAIPLVAVDRVEIVADGASALYGSDAVAGVANVILRRDYDGFATTARFGASTDGGNEQQQYTALGGMRWNGGGFLATYDFQRTTPVLAGQRNYTQSLWRDTTILPPIKDHNALLTVHHELAPTLEVTLDALYNHRNTASNIPFTNTGDYRALGSLGFSQTQAFALAPSVRLSPSARWNLSLTAVYGEDNTDYGSETYQNGSVLSVIRGTYHNTTRSIELSGEGALLELPGGSARVATGIGYRRNDYVAFRVHRPRQVDESQDARYGYVEFNLPVIGPTQDIAFVRTLTLNLAARYEDYPGIDQVTTPKLGLIFSPFEGLSLKGTWGRSFKAPQFYQRFAVQNTYIYDAAAVGGTGYPANATVLFRTGGNRDIGPERATTWTATLAIEPPSLKGASFEATYFSVNYRDRVVAPFPSAANALSNAAYASLVNRSPTPAQIAASYGASDQIFNPSGRPYDPGSVVAVIDGVNTNASSQKIHGIDLIGRYSFDLGNRSSGILLANVSYIDSKQQLSAGQPTVQLAGTIFNPPQFRARGGGAYENDRGSFSAYVNYFGGVVDDRSPLRPRVSPMATVDLSARMLVLGTSRDEPSLELALSAQNVLNAKPDRIAQPYVYATPFDSTNYSAVGRFVSFSVSKRF